MARRILRQFVLPEAVKTRQYCLAFVALKNVRKIFVKNWTSETFDEYSEKKLKTLPQKQYCFKYFAKGLHYFVNHKYVMLSANET